MARAEVGRSLRWLERVARATASASFQTDMASVFEVVLDETEALGANAVALFLADVERRELRLVAHRNLATEAFPAINRISFDAPLLAAHAVARNAFTMVSRLEDLPSDLALARELMERQNHFALAAAPLKAHGRLLGALAMGFPRAQPFSEDEVSALSAILDAFAVAIDGCQAREAERSTLARMNALRWAVLAISTPLELPDVLKRIVEEARRISDADHAALGIFDRKSRSLPFSLWVESGARPAGLMGSLDGSPPRPVGILAGPGLGQPPYRLCRPALTLPELDSLVAMAVRFRGEDLGNLYLAKVDGRGVFSEDDQRFLELLAQHAGIAVAHAREHARALREIDERRRAELALIEKEERFRRIAENAPDVLLRFRIRPRAELEYISPAVEAILGVPCDEVFDLGRAIRLVDPRDRPGVLAMLLDPESAPRDVSVRFVHRDGRTIWSDVRLVPVRDESGEIYAMEGIARDVTESRSTEREVARLLSVVREERARLETVIDTSPVGIAIIEGSTGARVRMNREARALLGRQIDPEKGIDQLTTQVTSNYGQKLSLKDLVAECTLHGKEITTEELICERPDAPPVPALVSGVPLRDPSGGVSGAVVILKEITSIKEMERMRSEWTSIIAHDLRQPVNAIALQAELLARRAEEPWREKAKHILAGANRLSRMVADLLDYTRLESRHLTIEPREVDLGEVTHEVVEQLEEAFGDRHVRIEEKSRPVRVNADPMRLEQILFNLLSNALKYGRPKTDICLELERKDGEAQVSVLNEGEPIPDEELNKLFRRFQRARSARGREGLGLGLYIARGLVEAHGGRIWAESAPGAPIAFRFCLPVSKH